MCVKLFRKENKTSFLAASESVSAEVTLQACRTVVPFRSRELQGSNLMRIVVAIPDTTHANGAISGWVVAQRRAQGGFGEFETYTFHSHLV